MLHAGLNEIGVVGDVHPRSHETILSNEIGASFEPLPRPHPARRSMTVFVIQWMTNVGGTIWLEVMVLVDAGGAKLPESKTATDANFLCGDSRAPAVSKARIFV
jgi:hypothetical protein